MKCLRINNDKGEFSLDGTTFKAIDEIKKEDILTLIDIALDPAQELEMDEYDSDLLKNPAHQVIYSSLHEKFNELQLNKEQFIEEANERYQEAYDKYKLQEEPGDDGA